MNNQPGKINHTSDQPRFEEVLLCAPEGDQPVAIVRTIKWETVREWKKNKQGEDVEETIGFLVTVPLRNALKMCAHICHITRAHALAVSALENGNPQKDRTAGNLPAAWNGLYDRCPLCFPPTTPKKG
jgi:hypothetical protein